MKTRISVIIPVYNVEEFLNECVDSVLDQSINNMELTDGYERNLQILLIDDGSTDDSAIIAKKYAEKYENVEYIYEENQGLGHARNYGCEFAEGDYIIFLDSDDLVRPYAYENMYKLAIKNNSDLVTGAIWRFNSKGYWRSTIHEIAFSGSEDCIQITDFPKIIYDTTSPNKLIKRSFWDKYEFKFPEGVLYEDIPVTIPMFYLANNISLVYENCYLWRIREGISKSITQNTNSKKNLVDRLNAMSLVDDFFKENVNDETLIHTKEAKWLKIDLMIFIDKFKSISEEESGELMDILCEYINNNINPESFKYLNEVEELKYKYLLEKDFKNLVNLLNFDTYELKNKDLYLKDSHIMADCNDDMVDFDSLCLDKYVKDGKLEKYIVSVDYRKEAIEIKGFMAIPGLKDDSFEDRKYSFNLVNLNSQKKIPLEYEDIIINNISSFNFPFKESFSYAASGYKISIPYSILNDNPDFSGENRISVSFTQDGITHNVFSGFARNDVKRSSDLRANIKEDTYFIIKYDLNNDVIIDMHHLEHLYDKITAEDNKLCIYSPENYGNVNLYYEKDSINDEIIIPFDYDEEKKCYCLDIDKILPYEGRILYDNGLPLVHNDKKLIFLHSNKGQCILNTLRDYNYDIFMSKNISVIEDKINREEQTLNFKAKLYSSEEIEGKDAKIRLFLKDEKTNQNSYLLDGKYIKESNEAEFNINLFDESLMKHLYQGKRDFYIEYNFGDTVFSTLLYSLKQFDYKYGTRFKAYHIYRGFDSTLRIRVSKRNLIFDNKYYKKYDLTPKLYKLFKLLPLKKKTIMFESMWGTKYSCSPRYLYEYIDENHPDYECIWSLDDEDFPINGNGIKVRRNGLKYFYYLARSKYFVDNVNFANNFEKRNGQVYIQTMHGTPLKTLGLDVAGEFPNKKAEKEFIERCDRWDYLTVQSDFVADISKSCFDYKKEFLKYGYPRTDILYTRNNEKDIAEIKRKLGIPTDKKVILYAPTWRLMHQFDLRIDLDSFRKSLSDEYVLVLRLHHYSVKGWKQPKQDDFIYDLTSYESIEELYLISDILITDYSSVMFDYALLDRPILLFTYDLEVYRDKLRGLYVDIEENRPGPMLFNSDELEDAIVNIDQTEKETAYLREKFKEKFLQHECENSSEKIFNDMISKKKRK